MRSYLLTFLPFNVFLPSLYPTFLCVLAISISIPFYFPHFYLFPTFLSFCTFLCFPNLSLLPYTFLCSLFCYFLSSLTFLFSLSFYTFLFFSYLCSLPLSLSQPFSRFPFLSRSLILILTICPTLFLSIFTYSIRLTLIYLS